MPDIYNNKSAQSLTYDSSTQPDKGRRALKRFLEAEKRNTPVLFWALLVGSLAGLVGAVFQIILIEITRWRISLIGWAENYDFIAWGLPILLSAVMVYVALLIVRNFAPETSGSGVQEIEGALDEERPLRWKRVLPIKFLGGIFALGGGMVLGREGPTIQMGGNIGKMMGDLFKVPKDELHILVAAGAGAGLAAAFNAPFAGILFVIEEMRPHFKFTFLSFQSVMVASAMSDIVLRSLMGQGPDIVMPQYPSPALSSLWVFLIFGAIFGLFGYLFNHLLIVSLNFFAGLRGWLYMFTGLIVGAIIGLLGWLFPNTIGGGYDVIPKAIQNTFPVMTLLVLFIARFGTTAFSYGSGAPGGIFAPMLALGTLFGLWFGHFTHELFPAHVLHPEIFAVAGMGALFSATVRAPLTGIALTIEMTLNYSQILPLILTCMSATIVAQGLGGRPIYTILLHRTLKLAKSKTNQVKEG
ncbi:MAG TPA: H(+)/Cl(-) exchange transporter ClcA [Thermodesulfobacteriota bacterium]